MKFTIKAERNANDKRVFFYDNTLNRLEDEHGQVLGQLSEERRASPAAAFDVNEPLKKSKLVKVLKIQLGLSCNYSCTYCSQRFVERADETNVKDVTRFVGFLDSLDLREENGLKIEFWGGEPLVYIKTLQPLVAALNERFEGWKKAPVYSIITNGSLLTREINDWLVLNGFHVGISHDGPGQHVRGPDPLNDPATKAAILNLYKRLNPTRRISFNAMLNVKNTSRAEIQKFFIELTGDPNVVIGEGGLVDAYDEGGLEMLRMDEAQHYAFRRQAFNDIYSAGESNIGFFGIISKMQHFAQSLMEQVPSETLAQKCGMDDEHVLAVDLRGNVVTCQNVSAVAKAPNGQNHRSGHITKMDEVRVKTSTHWSKRPHCAGCPVLHLCQGSCMYLEGERWDVSCAGAYSDAVVLFALVIELLTGYIPYEIVSEDQTFPAMRRDIWGTASLATAQGA